MQIFAVDDLNEAWLCERVLALLEASRSDEAKALSEEWGLCFDALENIDVFMSYVLIGRDRFYLPYLGLGFTYPLFYVLVCLHLYLCSTKSFFVDGSVIYRSLV